MDLLLIGASHRTARVDARGCMAAAAAGLPALARQHGAPAGLTECFVLSTCHRVEVLAVVADVTAAQRWLTGALVGETPPEAAGLYVHAGAAAVTHLSRVAAGLDSLIVGEAEISGQIRRALASSREAGVVGPVLERVVAGVLKASGRARSETGIGQGAVSAATAGVTLLERAWGSLDGRTVVVLGAGEAGRQALGRLRKRGAGRLLIASRSSHHANAAAAKAGAEVVALDQLDAALERADGLIAATTAPGYQFLVDGSMCVDAMAARPDRSLTIVDLSVPRVVDPAVVAVAGVALHTVDDLGDVVRESVRRREREIPHVERIVSDEAARTYQQFVIRRDRVAVA